MNVCQTTILLNNGKYCKGNSKRFKRKFQGFSGLFCFSNRLINREIGIWRRSAVEPGREKRLRGCWTLSESADSVAQRAVVRAAFKSRMLPPTPQSSCISTKPVYKISSATWLTHNPVRSEMATRVRTTYIECYQIVLNIRADRHFIMINTIWMKFFNGLRFWLRIFRIILHNKQL